MISKVFTKNLKGHKVLLPILLIALILRLYKINYAFPFDFDQEAPALAAYDFFINHKISLIGQELSFEGFFLGPLHNWVEFIPYGTCNLMPDCVPYFFTLLSLLNVVALYFTSQKIFDKKTAIITSFVYAISYGALATDRNVASNFFVLLALTGLLYALKRYFEGKNLFLIVGAFISGVAVVNFTPIFIFPAIAFFITAILKKEKQPLIFVAAAFAFLINYLPLFIFNIRHNNLIVNSLLNFANQNSAKEINMDKLSFVVKDVLVPYYTNYVFHSSSFIFTAFGLVLVAIGLYKLSKFEDKYYYFFPILIATTILGFTAYGGHIPDYYFQPTLIPFVLLMALALKTRILLAVFIPIFLIMNLQAQASYSTENNYQVKKEVVKRILASTEDESFNVYYNLPTGFSFGFDYLFRAMRRQYKEGAKNLYILESSTADAGRYMDTFSDKQVSTTRIGAFQIVSVK
ncbi:MAG: glycosyltransferase family 39 protein [Candidatus Curtissbacteria bacterium]|nr:glycosyltransferase family 39 protein [Candidatus Curtissbacteria bacterium]